jgi:hypothetical protein
MRLKYAIYKINSGEILRVVSTATPENQCVDVTEGWVEGSPDDRLAYILNGAVTDKPAMPCTLDKDTILANGIDAAILGNLPNPSIVTVGSQVVEVTDGTLTIRVNYAKDYPVKVESFPYLDWQGVIHGT